MNKKRILLVDDDEKVVSTFERILLKTGYDVETATTGKEALEKARKAVFHLAIIDIKLPDIIGDKVARQLKIQNERIGLVLITGFPHFQDCIDILDIGVHDILLKPITPSELLQTIEEALLKQ